ncbi:outer membrane protein assembly factor BamE [Burkholderiaceae bacterium UC74_6]
MRTRLPNVLLRPLLGASLIVSLSACSSMPSLGSIASVSGDKVMGMITPYRVEIVQGNVLTKEQVARVKPGMEREQVKDLLGTPLLNDIFHADRWDYTFTIRRQGSPFEQRKVVAWFKDDKLDHIDLPDNLPTEKEFVAAISPKFSKGEPRKLQLTEAEIKALPIPPKPPETVSDIQAPQRTYPPLESGA